MPDVGSVLRVQAKAASDDDVQRSVLQPHELIAISAANDPTIRSPDRVAAYASEAFTRPPITKIGVAHARQIALRGASSSSTADIPTSQSA